MDTETACCGEQRQLTWVVSEMGNWRAARIRCSAQRALAPEAVPGLPVSARTSAVSRFRRPVPGARLVRSADGAGKKEKEKRENANTHTRDATAQLFRRVGGLDSRACHETAVVVVVVVVVVVGPVVFVYMPPPSKGVCT